MSDFKNVEATNILNSLGDGVYVTDTERRIIYWNKSAERITGWSSEEMCGRFCYDSLLQHVDKDGQLLCSTDHCPLHRSIVTDTHGNAPLVFALHKNGHRIPVQVSVAPVRGDNSHVIGGVETFHDLSENYLDLQQAKAIQAISMEHELPEDNRIRFATCYMPHDIVGGDYYGIRKLGDDQYGFFLADVMGHGLKAALYTMELSSLWDRYCHLLKNPPEFAETLNSELSRIVAGGDSFAVGTSGLVDLAARTVTYVGAGNPPGLAFRANGTQEQLDSTGFPFAVIENASYEAITVSFGQGDSLLFFSDGAIEVENADGQMLGTDGLVTLLGELGYPQKEVELDSIQDALLQYSNAIRLDDDLTILEIRMND